MKTVYKILKNDGTFSLGGTIPSFGKRGKAWTSASGLGNHLTLVADYGPYTVQSWTNDSQDELNRQKNLMLAYHDCEIVQYEMVEGSRVSVLSYNKTRRGK